jgi:mannose-6-phosphate isomerase-like protein (cupin superfamily)
MAQDAAKADPERYRVEFENDQVRVLRINYGPHHKGVMHEHPASIAVWVTDAKATITTAGVTEEVDAKAGDVTWMDATKHQGENTSDQPFEVIQIELKDGSAGTWMSGTLVCDPPSQEHALPVEGRPHHSYVVNQTKCTWTKPWMIRGLASTKGVGTGTVDNHGMVSFSSGTYVDTMENGDKAYYDYSFKTKTKDGKAMISGHKWKLLGGTGTLKGAKGKGSCDATMQDDGTVLYQCQGKYK